MGKFPGLTELCTKVCSVNFHMSYFHMFCFLANQTRRHVAYVVGIRFSYSPVCQFWGVEPGVFSAQFFFARTFCCFPFFSFGVYTRGNAALFSQNTCSVVCFFKFLCQNQGHMPAVLNIFSRFSTLRFETGENVAHIHA